MSQVRFRRTIPLFTVATTTRFDDDAKKLWSETEIDKLVIYVASNPLAGDLIKETGGLRKLRWARKGMGKSGGARVVTYAIDKQYKVWLLTAYAKSDLENLGAEKLLNLKKDLLDEK